jgi:hypothetical protein
MKAILTTSLFLLIASAHFSFGQTKTTTVITKTITKETEEETAPIDTAKGTVTRTYTFTFNTKFGGTFGVYNFWEATRNLSQAVNTALPAARRFGFGVNYYVNAMFNNRHWTGINIDLLANSERSQNGYTANCFAANVLFYYGVNVKSKSSKNPLFPFVAFGPGSTNLILNSNSDFAASNLTTQFSSANITSNYLAYKVGITSMTINKKGYPSSIVQLGYLGGINNDNWTSSNRGKITGLKAFALRGVYLTCTL